MYGFFVLKKRKKKREDRQEDKRSKVNSQTNEHTSFFFSQARGYKRRERKKKNYLGDILFKKKVFPHNEQNCDFKNIFLIHPGL